MAERWKVGDRVRLGNTRGGYIVSHRGRAMVLWPDLVLTWPDHCEPDEDGDPWHGDRCYGCGREHRKWKDPLCINCGTERPPLPEWVKTWQQANRKG